MSGDALRLGRYPSVWRRTGHALDRHFWFSTYGLKALEREMSTCLRSLCGVGLPYGKLYLTVPLVHVLVIKTPTA